MVKSTRTTSSLIISTGATVRHEAKMTILPIFLDKMSLTEKNALKSRRFRATKPAIRQQTGGYER